MPRPFMAPSREDAEIEFNRVVAFTDGVFAIAITLLVLTLEVPSSVDDLGRQLRDQSDEFLAYGLSFAVLARLWLAHHRFFSTLARFDGTMLVLNLLYLAFVTLVPFTSDMLGNYSGESVAVIVYASNLAAVTLVFGVQISHSYRSDLVRDWAKPYLAGFAGLASYLVAGVFLLSIPVALISPTAATLLWLTMFFTGPIADRVAGQKVPK